MILNLPATPGSNHNSVKLLLGPDHYLYTVIGDQGKHRGQLQNIRGGPPPDNTSVILRVNPENVPTADNPFFHNSIVNYSNNTNSSSISIMNRYYVHGLRNSFGLAIDPVTGNLVGC